jgi:inorganic pyrophosphatase
MIYPLDYGYLKGTSGGDGNEVDVWLGSAPGGKLDAVICTVDMLKRDVEIKLLVGCTAEEKARVCRLLNESRHMAAFLVGRTDSPLQEPKE